MQTMPVHDRRRRRDSRLGRRSTDAWFPYSTAFVAQALAQSSSDATGKRDTKSYDAAPAARPSLALTV